jgi:hypothetical protein
MPREISFQPSSINQHAQIEDHGFHVRILQNLLKQEPHAIMQLAVMSVTGVTQD